MQKLCQVRKKYDGFCFLLLFQDDVGLFLEREERFFFVLIAESLFEEQEIVNASDKNCQNLLIVPERRGVALLLGGGVINFIHKIDYSVFARITVC